MKFVENSLCNLFSLSAGLLRAVASRYRYCSGANYTVAVAVAPLLFHRFLALRAAATFEHKQFIFGVSIILHWNLKLPLSIDIHCNKVRHSYLNLISRYYF